MKTKEIDIAKELEMLETAAKEAKEERRKQLYRHKLPEKRDLRSALSGMTKMVLEDICYNLNVTGVSSLKKDELVERLLEAVPEFSRRWFPSMLEEEYGCFRHLMEHSGISTELRDDDIRLDYLMGLGLVSCGVQEGKLAWYMPEEIREEFRKIDSGVFRSAVELNTEIARLATGLLFYCGYLNFDQLYAMVGGYLEKEARETVSFMDFVGIMLNAACWKRNIGALPHGMKYYTLISADKLENEQCRRSNLDFARLPYDKVYEAGEDNYIEATDAYKALAQFIMKEHGYDVLKAADVVGEILILLQNGNAMKDVVEYLEALGLMADDRKAKAVVPLLMDFNNSTHLWPLKGHTPGELMGESKGKVIPFGRHKAKAKRNDPCPCGSGKKYKNCCMAKDEEK